MFRTSLVIIFKKGTILFFKRKKLENTFNNQKTVFRFLFSLSVFREHLLFVFTYFLIIILKNNHTNMYNIKNEVLNIKSYF